LTTPEAGHAEGADADARTTSTAVAVSSVERVVANAGLGAGSSLN